MSGSASLRSAAVAPVGPPSAPRIGTAVVGVAGGNITTTVTWSAPQATGGSAITGYLVTALRMNGTGAVLANTVSMTQTSTARSLSMTLTKAGLAPLHRVSKQRGQRGRGLGSVEPGGRTLTCQRSADDALPHATVDPAL